MKRILLFLSAVFIATTAIAEQITINWGADNEHYTATSCEIGNDVILPTTPTKRGHIFKGWIAEHFNRGIFADWNNVPVIDTSYAIDSHNNHKPLKNDYIIVSDSRLYAPLETANKITLYHARNYYNMNYLYFDYNTGLIHSYNTSNTNKDTSLFGINEELRLKAPGDGKIYIYANANNVVCNGTTYNSGDLVFEESWTNTSTIEFYFPKQTNILSGTWKFVYQGTWETDGKYGWKPSEQIISQ